MSSKGSCRSGKRLERRLAVWCVVKHISLNKHGNWDAHHAVYSHQGTCAVDWDYSLRMQWTKEMRELLAAGKQLWMVVKQLQEQSNKKI